MNMNDLDNMRDLVDQAITRVRKLRPIDFPHHSNPEGTRCDYAALLLRVCRDLDWIDDRLTEHAIYLDKLGTEEQST